MTGSSGGPSMSNIILIVFLVVVAFGALKGLMRGFCRQLVRTLTIAASVLVAFLVTNKVSSVLNTNLEGKTLETLLGKSEITGLPEALQSILLSIDAETARVILAIPVAVVLLPLIFTLAFVLISAVGEIVHIIVSAIFGFTMFRNNAATRFLGLLLGGLQGALVAAILLFPIGCLANVSTGMLNAISDGGIKEGSKVESTYELIDEYISAAKDDKIINLTMELGGNKLQDKFSKVNIGGKETDARDPFYTLTGFYGDYSYLEGCKFKNLTDEQKKAINDIEDKATHTEMTADIISSLLRELASAVNSGSFKINLPAPYNHMLEDAIAIFATSTPENLDGDLNVFLDVYYQLTDCGALAAMSENPDNVTTALTQKPDGENTVISNIIHTLDNYERTQPLVGMITKLTVTIMSGTINTGSGTDAAELYDTVKGGLNDIATIDKNLSVEEYKSEVSNKITDVLADSEIEMTPEVVDGMADYVTENFKESDQDSFTDAEINDIIISYYDAYLNANGTLPGNPPAGD